MIYPIKLRKMCESLIYSSYKNNQLNSVKDLCDFIKENKYSGMEENKLIPFNYTHETMNKFVFNKLLDLPRSISNKDGIYDELVDLYIESKSNPKLSEDILLSILSKEELNNKTIKKLLKNECIFSEKTLDIIINKDGEKVYKYKDKTTGVTVYAFTLNEFNLKANSHNNSVFQTILNNENFDSNILEELLTNEIFIDMFKLDDLNLKVFEKSLTKNNINIDIILDILEKNLDKYNANYKTYYKTFFNNVFNTEKYIMEYKYNGEEFDYIGPCTIEDLIAVLNLHEKTHKHIQKVEYELTFNEKAQTNYEVSTPINSSYIKERLSIITRFLHSNAPNIDIDDFFIDLIKKEFYIDEIDFNYSHKKIDFFNKFIDKNHYSKSLNEVFNCASFKNVSSDNLVKLFYNESIAHLYRKDIEMGKITDMGTLIFEDDSLYKESRYVINNIKNIYVFYKEHQNETPTMDLNDIQMVKKSISELLINNNFNDFDADEIMKKISEYENKHFFKKNKIKQGFDKKALNI